MSIPGRHLETDRARLERASSRQTKFLGMGNQTEYSMVAHARPGGEEQWPRVAATVSIAHAGEIIRGLPCRGPRSCNLAEQLSAEAIKTAVGHDQDEAPGMCFLRKYSAISSEDSNPASLSGQSSG